MFVLALVLLLVYGIEVLDLVAVLGLVRSPDFLDSVNPLLIAVVSASSLLQGFQCGVL